VKFNKDSVQAVKKLMAVVRKEEGDERSVEEIVEWLRDDITPEEYFGTNIVALENYKSNVNKLISEQENVRRKNYV